MIFITNLYIDPSNPPPSTASRRVLLPRQYIIPAIQWPKHTEYDTFIDCVVLFIACAPPPSPAQHVFIYIHWPSTLVYVPSS